MTYKKWFKTAPKKGTAPKGWHIAKGKELKAVEQRMEQSGFMSRQRPPKGHPLPNSEEWAQLIVKDRYTGEYSAAHCAAIKARGFK